MIEALQSDWKLELVSQFGDVNLKSDVRDYTIHFHSCDEKLAEVIAQHEIIIADKRVIADLPIGRSTVIELEASEAHKNMATVSKLLEDIVGFGMSRHSKVAVVGGGLLQDIGGFSASILMRGVSWSFFPTTLLAMGDSCVGGKTSINLSTGKNLVGSFYPPSEIHVFFSFLKTLPIPLRVEGLIEIMKILAVAGELANSSFDVSRLLEAGDETARIVYQSIKSKKIIVEADERDTGSRQLLNLGHTFAHALEESSGWLIPHGIAVGIGIVAASNFVRSLGHSADQSLELIVSELLDTLPKAEVSIDWQKFRAAILKDKKWTAKTATLILPFSLGIKSWSTEISSLVLNTIEQCARNAMQKSLGR